MLSTLTRWYRYAHRSGDATFFLGIYNMLRKMSAAVLLACAAAALPSTALAVDYALKQRFAIGGDGGWDYLTYEVASNRLFVSRGTRVQVIDPDHGTVLSEIPDTPGVHGIALADDLGKGFVSNGRDNSVTVFDLKTLKTLAKIGLEGGENPDFILYDAFSKRVFVFNGRSSNASVIDAAGARLLATIPLRGKPEAAVTDGAGTVFVNIEDKNEITAIDARKAAVIASWPLPGCKEPAGLAMDTATRRLFAGCHNKSMAIVNADNGKLVATMSIGEGVDANVFDPQTKLIFSSQGDGTRTVVKEETADQYTVVQNVATQRGARTMALNSKSHEVYLVSADFEEAAPTQGQQHPRRTIKPGTFTLLIFGAKPISGANQTPSRHSDADTRYTSTAH
jgi:DNA-binding beta-propeller fold protein YncE